MKKFITSLIIVPIILLLFLFTLHETSATSFGLSGYGNNKRPTVPYSDIIESNNGYYIGADEKVLYLTFDCGYENGYTKDILNTLRCNNIPATFFITGHYLNTASDIVSLMIEDGHIVGNHTYSHTHFTKENTSQMLNDVSKLEQEYFKLFSKELDMFVRPPAGEFNEESLKVLSNNGYKTIFWSLAYVDWYKDKYNGNNYSYKEIMKKIHNGAIILMHTVSKDNKEDLDLIIKSLKEEGYVFKSLYEL